MDSLLQSHCVALRQPRGPVLAFAVMLLAAHAASAQDAFKVIVNQANPVTSLTRAQIAQDFLDRSTWDDGTPVAPVDLPATSPVREAFSREMLGVSAAAASAKWQSAGASRGGSAPPAMATDREVLAYVRLKPGAIGYVSATTEATGVKVVSIGRTDVPGASQTVLDVGGSIPMPERISGRPPEYPVVARNGHVEGDVDLEVIIGATGTVEKARVVRSIPMLDGAALDAVKQWRYKPTVVNGAPVAIRTRIRVSFSL